MPPIALVALAAGCAALAVHLVSLFFENEGFRGVGRVFLGLGLVGVGAFVHAVARVHHLEVYIDAAGAFIAFTGLVTSALGVRKYLRRPKPAAPSKA